jgi:hypothetical protein
MKWHGELSRVKMNAKKTAPLTTLHATREVTAMSEKKIRRAATSALTFMTFS